VNATSLDPDSRAFWQHLQDQIDTLERNCIAEFQANAGYQNARSMAPFINRLEALEGLVAELGERFRSRSEDA
jgi:hypothetical protein